MPIGRLEHDDNEEEHRMMMMVVMFVALQKGRRSVGKEETWNDDDDDDEEDDSDDADDAGADVDVDVLHPPPHPSFQDPLHRSCRATSCHCTGPRICSEPVEEDTRTASHLSSKRERSTRLVSMQSADVTFCLVCCRS